MNREDYLNAVKNSLEPNIVHHSLALEVCMGGIYDYLKNNNLLKPDELPKEDWTLAGLIHDIDYYGEFKEFHTLKTKEALAKFNLEISDDIDKLVKSHGPKVSGVQPSTQAQWSIFCADSLTGLITAVALVYPSKKLADVKVSSVLKRFLKEPKFAAGTRRDEVIMCELPTGLNIPLEKFIEICLTSMQQIAPEIGL
jgi:predicted hydrolase (HD superfamily)